MKSVKALHSVILVFPFFFLVPPLSTLFQKPLVLFPPENRVFYTDAYADGDEETLPGKRGSSVDIFKTDLDSITMAYTLRDVVDYPYAGIFFSMVTNGEYTDLSGYDYMKLTLSAAPPQVYQVKITTFIEGYTDERDSNTFCPLEKTLFMKDSMIEYRIPISEFELLAWWLEDTGLKAADYKARTLLKKAYQINLQQTKQMKPGTQENGNFTIKGISLHKSFGILYAVTGAGFLISAILSVFFFLRVRKKQSIKNGSPRGEWSPVTLDSYSDIDTKRLSEFIEGNYTNPELSVAMLYKETGISRQRIAALVKNKYRLPFKPLLNKIRLSEAARLLVETDRNITDIAMALGFGGPSYFFQVFRAEYRMSPSEYRKKYGK
jgi:AraC-like DNA-binding protein